MRGVKFKAYPTAEQKQVLFQWMGCAREIYNAKCEEDNYFRIPVYILAGGKSSRFGSDKALAILQGTPLILHVAETLKPLASHITIVAEQVDKYHDLGLMTLADLWPGLGPMGGLYTALHHASSGWIFIASCDVIGLKITWAQQLFAQLHEGAQAIAFRSRYWEPLFTFYHTAILSQIESCIKKKQLALWYLLESIQSIAVSHPADWSQAIGINIPADLNS